MSTLTIEGSDEAYADGSLEYAKVTVQNAEGGIAVVRARLVDLHFQARRDKPDLVTRVYQIDQP